MKRLNWDPIKQQIIDLDTDEVVHTENHDGEDDFCDVLSLPNFEKEAVYFILEVLGITEDFSIFGLKFNSKTSQVTGTLKL